MPIKIGTRGSRLALVQTENVVRQLAERDVEVETVIIRTQGDASTGVPIHEIGGQGVFVRALDEAILDGEIDAAVHSMKDIPVKRPEGVVMPAVLPRDSPADFLAFDGDLEAVQVVGTSSTRRRAQVLRHDPTITIKPLRGNVDTRLRRLSLGDFDAIVLAEAGLQRLGYEIHGIRLPVAKFVPSPNQGTIAVVCRNEPALVEAIAPLNDPVTRQDTIFERIVMEEVGGGCYTPLGCYCRDGSLTAEVLSLDGKRTERMATTLQSEEEARECGRRFGAQARTLVQEAFTQLGIQHGG
jgi:hydroxymethylbilane synthase